MVCTFGAPSIWKCFLRPWNTLVLDNFVQIGNCWMWTSLWRTKTMLNESFKFIYQLTRLLMLLPAQHLLPLSTPEERKPKMLMYIKHCVTNAKAIPIHEVQKWFVLMQLHLMLKNFVCDAWLALWTLFDKVCTKTKKNSLLNNVSLINRT